MQISSNTAGALWLISGLAIFSVQDLILKLMADGNYPLHQAMVIRSIVALPFLLFLVRFLDGGLQSIVTPGWWKMLLRGGLNFLSYTFYYIGLAALPLPLTIALYFSAPLFITIFSAVFLGEKIRMVTALALIAGFGGVILIAQPGAGSAGGGLGWVAIMPVLGAVFYAISMVASRPLGRVETASAMAFWSNVCFLACALTMSLIFGAGGTPPSGHAGIDFLTRGWIQPSLLDTCLLALCGVIAAVGLTMLTQAYRVAAPARIAPFEYSFIFWGLLWGWAFWGDRPNATAWAGILIVTIAGLLVIRLGQKRLPEPAQAV